MLTNGDDKVVVKNRTGRLRVRALDPWHSILKLKTAVKGWPAAPEDLIIHVLNFNPPDRDQIPARWATLEPQPPQLRVIAAAS